MNKILLIVCMCFLQSCSAMIDNPTNKTFLSAITGGDSVQDAEQFLKKNDFYKAIDVKVQGTYKPRFLVKAYQKPIPMKFSTNLISYAALDCNVEVLKYLVSQAPKDKKTFALIKRFLERNNNWVAMDEELDVWSAWFARCFYEGKFHADQRSKTIQTGKLIAAHVKELDDLWLQRYFMQEQSKFYEELEKGLSQPTVKPIDQDIAYLGGKFEGLGDKLDTLDADFQAAQTKEKKDALEKKMDKTAFNTRIVRELKERIEAIKNKGSKQVDYSALKKETQALLEQAEKERIKLGKSLESESDDQKAAQIAKTLQEAWGKTKQLQATLAHIDQLVLQSSARGAIEGGEVEELIFMCLLLGEKKALEIFVSNKKPIYFTLPTLGDASTLNVAFALGDTKIFEYILKQAKAKLDDNALGSWFEFCLLNGWFAHDKVKNTLEFTRRISDVVTVQVTAPFMIRGLKNFLSDKSKFISSVLQSIPPHEARDKFSEKDEKNLSDAIDLYALLAVISGDWDMLQKLLDKKIEFDVLTLKGFNDYTLLHLATFVGQKEIVDQLVKTPFFDGEERDANGSTPGKIAQEYGYAKIAESILKLKKQREAEKKQSTEEQKQKDEKIFDEKLEEQRAKNRKDLVLPRLAKAIQNLKDKLAELNEKAAEFATKQPQVKQNAEA